ncbi:MAG: LarC family nickel insertion protein [Synergistaceae bacterium]
MNVLYLECNMGAAGDMLMSALYELLDDKAGFISKMNSAGLPGVNISPIGASSCGIAGTRIEVTVNGTEEESLDVHSHCHEHDGHGHVHEHDGEHGHGHEHTHGNEHAHVHEHAHTHCHEHSEEHAHVHHAHTSLADIHALIESMEMPEKVKQDAAEVYDELAKAESAAHGKEISQVHFHEVGAMDAIADIVGVSLALYMLAPEEIIASPIHMGRGLVRCAHGIVPVPAPATAALLKGIPCYSTDIEGELCTPTGAALIRHFAGSYAPMPVMTPKSVGYGIGKKSFPAANCVRAFLGEKWN